LISIDVFSSIIEIIVLTKFISFFINLRQGLFIVILLSYSWIFIFDLICYFAVFHCCYLVVYFLSNKGIFLLLLVLLLLFSLRFDLGVSFILLSSWNWCFVLHDSIWIFIEKLCDIWVTPEVFIRNLRINDVVVTEPFLCLFLLRETLERLFLLLG